MNFEVVASSKSFGVINDSLNEAKTFRWELKSKVQLVIYMIFLCGSKILDS